jgi:hypothetical protein
MSYTLKFSHPHFPEGMEFNVNNLGRVPNGGSLEIDEDMERGFMMINGVPLEDTFKDDVMVELTGTSELDQSEKDAILEFFNPPEVEAPVVEEDGTTPDFGEPQTPAFLANTPNEGVNE